jgi:hypothetical protein
MPILSSERKRALTRSKYILLPQRLNLPPFFAETAVFFDLTAATKRIL